MVNRILQLIDFYSINKSVFYKKTGLSNGFLDKVTDIGVTKLDLILKSYPDINPEWLINGTGEMFRVEHQELPTKNIEMKDFSLIKQNVLTYLKSKNISKYEFYKITGISNGVLSQSNGVSEENLLKILSCFPDINAEWLITGNGQESNPKAYGLDNTPISTVRENIGSYGTNLIEEENAFLREKIKFQEEKILFLQEKIFFLQQNLDNEIAEKKLSADVAKMV